MAATKTLTARACTITGTGVTKWSAKKSISKTLIMDIRAKMTKGQFWEGLIPSVPIIFHTDAEDDPIVFYTDAENDPIVFYEDAGRLSTPSITLTAPSCTISGTGELA